jgi:FecR protein
MRTTFGKLCWRSATFAVALAIVLLTTTVLPTLTAAQDQDDPPSRVARLGYMEGSVSFLPAGETDWVGAVPNRPMTTGDQLWTDQNSRAELQLGSSVIRLAPNTSFSFLDLDDQTVQIQLTSGAISVTVRRLSDEDDFEIDTPNQAFTIFQPGHYRVEASSDGNYTVISVREGEGEATGGGQSFDLRGGQRATLSGSDQLYAEVVDIGYPDDFDNWATGRDHRYDYSRSAQYLSHDVVGYEDLDDYGDWRDDGDYGHVWFPNRIEVGWAPYHTGHWAWISPWGYTWVDDSPWGYAPFHYGRWVSVGERWGWVAGPVAVQAVYAPALVVFIGGGPGGFGGNVGWFPLGPREVFVPSYHVSEAYVTRVNVSSTTVNVTQVTNVYRTTIINNNTTNITNITYANRSVQGAVVVVPQRAFASAQPVAKVAVAVNAQQIAAAPVSARVAVVPTREAVQGGRASTAGHVAAPPAAIASRQVVAKKTPPPPPVPFAKQQQALAAHPGQPLAKNEVQTLRPAVAAAARPMVKVAPPAKPMTPAVGKPGAPPTIVRPGQPAPATRPAPPSTNPHAAPAQPAAAAPHQAPAPPAAAPHPAPAPPPQPNRAPAPPAKPAPPPSRPQPAQPENRPAAQPKPAPPAPAPRPQTPPPAEHPQPHNPPPAAQRPASPPPARTPPPAAAKPAPPPKPPAKPQTPEEKKREEEKKPPGV